MTEVRVVEMARKAAELLPEPPASHDPFGYLAWEELVVSTARRLHWLMGDAEPASRSESSAELPTALTLQPGTARLDGEALLVLAGLLATGDDLTCEGVLTQAVATCLVAPQGAGCHDRHPRHQPGARRRPDFVRGRRTPRGVAVAPRA